MKKAIITCCILFLGLTTFSQSNNSDQNLLVKYSKQELKDIKTNNPQEYKFLSYCVKNAFYIVPLPKKKVKQGNFKEITLKNTIITNFFDLNLELFEDKNQYIVIKGTEKMLVIKSKNLILSELKKK